MNKKVISSLLFFIFSLFFISGVDIEQITFIPREYFAGDIVDMRISLKNLQTGYLEVPEELSQADWVYIRNLELLKNEDGVMVHITFSPFQPGIRVLPPIDLGGIVLNDLRIDTGSVLEKEYSSFLPAEEPMYLPRTGLYFALLIGCVLGIPLITIFAFRILRKRLRAAVISAGRKRPYNRLQKVLKELERKILNRDGNVFYTTMLLELKNYLSARTGVDFSTLTSREVCLVLNNFYPEEFFRGTLEDLFKFSDQVKFGGVDPYTARKKEDLNRLDEVVKAVEIYYRHLWASDEVKGVSNVDS